METKLKKREKSELYKLVIPSEVETKIRLLLQNIYNIEWSGILFYTHEGNLKDGLTITCKDILPMNIGNSVFTEFEVNEEILPYMIEHDLMDCQQSLVHSHHSMDTFFSGTDMNTLYAEGSTRNNFVSLIVNNVGKYNAAITWKETYTIQGTATLFGTSEELNEAEEETQVCYSFMSIEKGEGNNTELLDRINELKSKSLQAKSKFPIKENTWNLDKTPTIIQQELPFEDLQTITKEDTIDIGKEFDIKVPDEIVEAAVAQLMTGSLTAKRLPKNDLDKVLNSIEERFAERFNGYDDDYDYAMGNLASTVIEGLTEHFCAPFEVSDGMAALASRVIQELTKYKDKLSHIETIIKEISSYE